MNEEDIIQLAKDLCRCDGQIWDNISVFSQAYYINRARGEANRG